MAKTNEVLKHVESDEILWHDRKRILGLPISFTVYEVDDSRFTERRGLFSTTTDEMLLYRILDLKMKQTLGQKLFGVGTIFLYTADQSAHTTEIKNIKHPDKVRKFLSHIVEQQRNAKGITGREMFGTASVGQSHAECGEVMADLDGDGVPDVGGEGGPGMPPPPPMR